MTIRILLIEDDDIMGESLVERFRLEGMDVTWLREARKAIDLIPRAVFNIVISDIRLPDMDGGAMFRAIANNVVDLPPIIFMTAYGTIERAVDLLKLGAVDYLCKPFDIDVLMGKILQYQRPMQGKAAAGNALRGNSQSMVKLQSLLPKYAKSGETVLITGESGVGKEYVAKLLHELDPRRSVQPFIAVNCAAIPESLVESELFGHERGAFTGALKTKKGAFEQAGTGTIFLDEIGDLIPSVQVKLLRVLQDRSARRVGGEQLINFACRVIAATNRPVTETMRQGLFRQDLLYRLNALQLHVPPLRERPDEILPLARDFLDACNRREGAEKKVLTASAEAAMVSYAWPGNVRELKNAVERAYLHAGGRLIDCSHMFDDSVAEEIASEPQVRLAAYLGQQERAYLVEQLTRHAWRITETAAVIGISRKTLWEKMRRFEITEPGNPRDRP